MFKPSIPQTRSLDKNWQALFGDCVDRFALYLSRPQHHYFRQQWVLEHVGAVLPAPYRDTTSALVTG
ncbi:MAG: hypothetical protein AB1445_15750 [Bacillota bacterium]